MRKQKQKRRSSSPNKVQVSLPIIMAFYTTNQPMYYTTTTQAPMTTTYTTYASVPPPTTYVAPIMPATSYVTYQTNMTPPMTTVPIVPMTTMPMMPPTTTTTTYYSAPPTTQVTYAPVMPATQTYYTQTTQTVSDPFLHQYPIYILTHTFRRLRLLRLLTRQLPPPHHQTQVWLE